MKKEEQTIYQKIKASGSYLVTPIIFTNNFGLKTGTLLSELLWCQEMLADKNGWFYRERKKIEKRFGLTSYDQNKGIKILIKEGFLQMKRKGRPPKNWYKINMETVYNFITNQPAKRQTDLTFKGHVSFPLNAKPVKHIYNKYDNNKYDNKLLSKESNKLPSGDSIDTDDSLSDKKILRERKKKYPISSNPFIPKQTETILTYWNTSGLHQHNNPNTKIYRNIIISIKRLMNGSFFKTLPTNGEYSKYKEKKWTQDEIIQAISNYSLAATNPDYKPKSEQSKEWLRNQSFTSFLFNGFLKDNDGNLKNQSLFLEYFDNKPELVKQSMRPLRDTYPKMTELIKEIYNKTVYNGSGNSENTVDIKNCFIKAARREADFIQPLMKNGRIQYYWISTLRKRAEMFIEAAISNLKDPSDLRPHYLCSDYMFNDIYPRYLNKQAILEN